MLNHTRVIVLSLILACSGLIYGSIRVDAGFQNMAFDGTTITGELVITSADLPANCSVNMWSYANPILDSNNITILNTTTGYFNATYTVNYIPSNANAITVLPWATSCYDFGGFWSDFNLTLDPTPINNALQALLPPTLTLDSATFPVGYQGKIGSIYFPVGSMPDTVIGQPATEIQIGITQNNSEFLLIGSYKCVTNCLSETTTIDLYNDGTATSIDPNLFTSSPYDFTQLGQYTIIGGVSMGNGGNHNELGQLGIFSLAIPPVTSTSTLDLAMPNILNTLIDFTKRLYIEYWPFVMAFAIVATASKVISKFFNLIAK